MSGLTENQNGDSLSSGIADMPVCASVEWSEIAGLVTTFLADVRQTLLSQVDSFIPRLKPLAEYALDKQGKLLRSTLLALVGNITGKLSEEHIKAAAVIELIHLATLIHDDVIDEAELRRGAPTLARKWDNRTAILLGDCILAQAMVLAHDLKSTDSQMAILTGARNVCIGETWQSLEESLEPDDFSEVRQDEPNKDAISHYLKVISLKTGELFAIATQVGAAINGVGADIVQNFFLYGREIGTAYQIYDDCVDIFATPSHSNKSIGIDLSFGKQTLPILLLQKKLNVAEQKQLQTLLKDWSPLKIKEIHPFMEKYSVLTDCAETIYGYLNRARKRLAGCSETKYLCGLQKIPQFLMAKLNELQKVSKTI